MKRFPLIVSAFMVLLATMVSNTAYSQGDNCASAIPLDVVVNGCEFTQVSNAGLINSGQTPVGVDCDAYAGGDLWLSVVMPPSGEVTVTTQLIPLVTPGAMDINMAVYSGSCGSLTLLTCDDDSGAGFFAEATFSGTPGETYYVQLWETNNNTQGSFNVCANGTATCVAPEATFEVDCGVDNQYSVTVNITSLGDADVVNITNDGGADPITAISSTGSHTAGPFSAGSTVTITLEHGSDPTCNISENLTDLGQGCDRTLDCEQVLDQSYCYSNNDDAVFIYSSPDGLPVTLTFISGLIESFDEITIRNGDNAAAPVLFSGSNGGDLSGLTRTAESGSIYLSVNSDGSASCQDGSLGLGGGWNWEVETECPSFGSCGEAAPITSQVTFAQSEIGDDLAGAPAGAGQCAGPGNNPERWFTFTAEGSVTYFRADGSGNFDPAVEVYDACGGELLACVNDAGAGQRELFWVTDLTPGADYVFRVYHAGASVPDITVFEAAVAHIPVIQLRSDFCGAEGLTPASIIRSTTPNPDFLLQNFVWEFTQLEAPFETFELTSPNGANPQFRMFWFPEVEYGRSYSVRVKARMYQGANLGDYGDACTITMAGGPTTFLEASFDDGFYNMCDILRAKRIPGAVNYRWTFTSGGTTLERNSNSSNNRMPLHFVSDLQLGTAYDVEVFATDAQGNEGNVSTVRTINMNNFVPDTELNSAQFTCGSTVVLTNLVNAVEVCNAESYTFRFTDITDAQNPPLERVRPTRVLQFAMVSGLIPGHTYNVQVKAASGGLEGEYATACEVTIDEGEQGRMPGGNTVDNAGLNQLDMTVYPNPVTGAEVMVTIDGLSDANSDVVVEIYNLTGQRIHQQNFGNAGNRFSAAVKLNGNIASGTYLLRTSVNGEPSGAEKIIIP